MNSISLRLEFSRGLLALAAAVHAEDAVLDAAVLAPPVLASEAAQVDTPIYSEATYLPLAMAATDGISTHLAIATGFGQEANSLVNTSPVGLLALFGRKAWLVYWTECQPESTRATALNTMSGIWGGVSANNLLIATAAATSALTGGTLVGVALYFWRDHQKSQIPTVKTDASVNASCGTSITNTSTAINPTTGNVP